MVRLLVLTMLFACTRRVPATLIENKVPIDTAPIREEESWWEYCERLGREPRYLEWRTNDFGIMIFGC